MNKECISKLINIETSFLMIDEIIELVPMKHARAVKYLDKNIWFIQSHLIGAPIMPGSLIIEGMLQTMVALIYKTIDHDGEHSFVTDIKTKFFKPIKAGSDVQYKVQLQS
jgi:3-hydroxyacyl-[acyl-carrier-protein] dehydratase